MSSSEERLCSLALRSPWLMEGLCAARSLGLQSWCIGAGAVRSLVWDALHSLEEAVASWTEYATAVGLWLDACDEVQVIAPHGLDDLFDCVVRRNPRRVSIETYRLRLAQKRHAERWPQVRVLPD